MTNTSEMRIISQRPANVLLHWSVGLLVTFAFIAVAWMGFSHMSHVTDTGREFSGKAICLGVIGVIGTLWALNRFTTIAPYQRLVVSLFGRYVGVDEREGLAWMIPFYASETVSTALSNFETEIVKVNDRGGSPIDIAVVVVHRIVDPAKAVYMVVGDVDRFVRQQVIAGIRAVAASHDYDGEESKAVEEAREETGGQKKPTRLTLRGDLAEVAEELRTTAQAGIGDIGVELVEVRITHLAYAPEIAASMLKRQQAQAVVAARETIVKGAVSIIEDTLKLLKEKEMPMEPDRQATLVGNLLVVLASDREAAPVLPLSS